MRKPPATGPGYVRVSVEFDAELARTAGRLGYPPKRVVLDRDGILRALEKASRPRRPHHPRIRPTFDPLAPTMGPWATATKGKAR